ncbi:MAG: AMP-binding protein, partial [Alphaproteobacteria bacterium]
LMDRVKRLAGGLTEHGFGAGTTVALMAPNMPDYSVALHGVAWAGGTVTPINPSYTAHEVHHQLVDAGAEMIIVGEACLDVAKEASAETKVRKIVVMGTGGGDVFPLDSLMGAAQAAQTPVDLDTHPATLPYSSGTTGLPKGVMLTHRNMATNVDQVLSVFAIEPGEATVVFLPFFHIYGLNALLNPYLAGGGCIVTMPRFDLELFLKLTQDHKAPRMYIAPPVALALAKHPIVDQFDFSSLRTVFSAAAPLGEDVASACAERLGVKVLQGYGMTELSPVSHVMPLDKVRDGAVGLTVPGTQCRIVDPESGADFGVDQEGELWVKGAQVMLGYLNNLEATAATIDSNGWLKTGDLGCFDVDGFLYIRDRLKELIKYKGFQVAPAELEDVLLSHPAIADAAVIGVPDPEAGELPAAFIVVAAGQAITDAEVMAHVRERLTSYKQVRTVEFVDAIPKSASGKILRRELRDRVAARSS